MRTQVPTSKPSVRIACTVMLHSCHMEVITRFVNDVAVITTGQLFSESSDVSL